MGGGVYSGEGIVVVHDQLGELGGCERVVEAILHRFPAAELVAPRFLTTNLPGETQSPLEGRTRVVWTGTRRRHFLAPLYAARMERVSLEGARVVVSTPGMGWCLAACVPSGARHVAYTTGVPRLLDGDAQKYLPEYPRPLRPLLAGSVPLLRAHYGRLLRRPHRVLTNSRWSVAAVERRFGIRAEYVYPPVRTAFFTPESRPRRHALMVARLVRHKRIDLVVEAFRGLDLELVVAGGGPLLDSLRASAPPNVRFTGYVSNEELRELYRSSFALVHPSVEEFGIAMAEAHACGTPVVGPRAGGALEIVREGETGRLLDQLDPVSIRAAVQELAARPPSPEACRAVVLRFSEERFGGEIGEVILEELARSAEQPGEGFPVPVPVAPEGQAPDPGAPHPRGAVAHAADGRPGLARDVTETAL